MAKSMDELARRTMSKAAIRRAEDRSREIMAVNDLEAGVEEILVRSSVDGSMEPSLWCAANSEAGGHDGARPLLVGLHSWSFGRHNGLKLLLPMARANGWHLLLPEFRGPNTEANPRAIEAAGSAVAMQDVIDAVTHVRTLAPVDTDRIFMFGGSGGGHMALMLAGYRPDLWRSVAAGVPITDLEAWHGQNPAYVRGIEAVCGGPPGPATRDTYRAKSPIHHAEKIARAELVIYHGKYDPAVPFTHSLNLYNEICRVAPNSRVLLEIFNGKHATPMQRVVDQFLGHGGGQVEVTK